MNKFNSCFICPIYDSKNHFSFGRKLLQSKISLSIVEDFYFIFSNKNQYRDFDDNLSFEEKKHYNFLILPDDFIHFKNQISVKKIWALNHLKNKYKFYAVLDSECLFIRKGDFSKLFSELWKNNLFQANFSPEGYFIQKKCYETVGLSNDIKLIHSTSNFKYNIWFSNIPIYNNDDLDEFNSFLKELDINKWGNETSCFDYYLYISFLIIKKGIKIKRNHYISNWGIIEELPQFNFMKVKKILNKMKPLWIPKGINSKIRENFFIEFHLDRVPSKEISQKIKNFFKYRLTLIRFTIRMLLSNYQIK
jgi:hypothetical protein